MIRDGRVVGCAADCVQFHGLAAFCKERRIGGAEFTRNDKIRDLGEDGDLRVVEAEWRDWGAVGRLLVSVTELMGEL